MDVSGAARDVCLHSEIRRRWVNKHELRRITPASAVFGTNCPVHRDSGKPQVRYIILQPRQLLNNFLQRLNGCVKADDGDFASHSHALAHNLGFISFNNMICHGLALYSIVFSFNSLEILVAATVQAGLSCRVMHGKTLNKLLSNCKLLLMKNTLFLNGCDINWHQMLNEYRALSQLWKHVKPKRSQEMRH